MGSITEFTRFYVLFQKRRQQVTERLVLRAEWVDSAIKSKEIEQAIELYKSGTYTISHITALTGSAIRDSVQTLKEQNG